MKWKVHKPLQPFNTIELFYVTNNNRKTSINSLKWSSQPEKKQVKSYKYKNTAAKPTKSNKNLNWSSLATQLQAFRRGTDRALEELS